MGKQFTVAILGCGNRGVCYTENMLATPEKYKIAAICDPAEEQIKKMHDLFGLEDSKDFTDVAEFLREKRADVLAGICKNINPENVFVEENMALIAVVGRGMIKAKGTAARIFTALANANVNIRMIDQGSSELNIIIGVDANDYITALKSIYNEFVK